MNDEINKSTIKYIIIGNTGVGKTNIIYRFVNGEFENSLQSTIGMEFTTKDYKIGENIFHLQLYDTGGAEHFGSLRQNYYNNADCVIIVYDITNKESFNSIGQWIEECENSHNEDLIKILVGNKTDLSKEKRKVTEKEGKDLADRYGIDFYETSALNGYNIEKIFFDCCKKIYKNSRDNHSDEEDNNEGENRDIIALNNENENNIHVIRHKSCCFH